MTLLTTEIHRSTAGDVIVFAADQRITRGGSAAETRQKIFRLPNRQAGIGYFGLAEVPAGTARQPMGEWLQDFFYLIRPADNLATIARSLAGKLNTKVPPDWRRSEPSGFHLAGLADDGRAEFWYVRNIDDSGRITLPDYEAREDFRSRDALTLAEGAAQVYRNGDVRAHVVAWSKIDESFGSLLGSPSFRGLASVADYVDWVKFKMHLVAEFYRHFATESIIGQPIDAFAIPDGT